MISVDRAGVGADSFNQDKLWQGFKVKELMDRSVSINRKAERFSDACRENSPPVWMWTSFLGLWKPLEFIIELRLRKCLLRCCLSLEEATLNVFRHRWDSSYPPAGGHRYACLCSGVHVCVLHLACVHSCVIRRTSLIHSQVHGAPSVCAVFDHAQAGCVVCTCHHNVWQTSCRNSCSLFPLFQLKRCLDADLRRETAVLFPRFLK